MNELGGILFFFFCKLVAYKPEYDDHEVYLLNYDPETSHMC